MNTRFASVERNRVLIIAPHGSYRTVPFLQAAKNLDIDVIIASQGKHSIVSDYAQGLHIDAHYGDAALKTILDEAKLQPFNVVIGTDDISTTLAARVAEKLNLPYNAIEAVNIARRKDLARQRLHDAAVRIPRFLLLEKDVLHEPGKIDFPFPAVIKPVALSGSRGVIRVNNQTELEQAIIRINAILEKEKNIDESLRDKLLLEEFIAGDEVAVEGMLYDGELDILAIFDKPEPLNGPFFEESYYITPTSQPENIQQAIKQTLVNACKAYGLSEGPIHAECRINESGVWVLEVAARTIGGMCGRLLSLATGCSLEELVIQHALGNKINIDYRDKAAGVLMIPIPGAGILKRVEGMLAAQRVPGVEEVNIQVRDGYELVPLPEGNSYLGFIFAQAESPQQAEAVLRKAHACLNFVVAPVWKVQLV